MFNFTYQPLIEEYFICLNVSIILKFIRDKHHYMFVYAHLYASIFIGPKPKTGVAKYFLMDPRYKHLKIENRKEIVFLYFGKY